MKKIILSLLILKASSLSAQDLKIDQVLSDFINEWKGTRYVLGGTTKRGIDCSGLNKKLYEKVYNLIIPEVCYKQWNATTRVNKDSLKPGDLIFFNSTRSPSGWHCGCYIGDNLFFHAPQRGDVVKISSMDDPKYRNRYKGAGRIIK